MFKELGEFIDNVGKDTASIIKDLMNNQPSEQDDDIIDLSELGEDIDNPEHLVYLKKEEDDNTKT